MPTPAAIYFRGYRAEDIAAFCRVTAATARELKAGRTRPSQRVLYLFRLHADGRVLPPTWRGWHFKPDGQLIYDNGVSFMPGELLAIEFLRQNGASELRLIPSHARNDGRFDVDIQRPDLR